MVLLIGEGHSFTFHVLARSRSEARAALRRAWKVHVIQTSGHVDGCPNRCIDSDHYGEPCDCDPNGASPRFEKALDITFIDDIRPERVYRDHSRLKVKGD